MENGGENSFLHWLVKEYIGFWSNEDNSLWQGFPQSHRKTHKIEKKIFSLLATIYKMFSGQLYKTQGSTKTASLSHKFIFENGKVSR